MSGGPRRWRRSEPDRLAQFVTPEAFAGHSLLRADGLHPAAPSAFQLLARLYENLRRQCLDYIDTLAPPGSGSEEQLILKPRELLHSRHAGDCVNLSLFFASMCAAVHLRPHIVLLNHPNRTGHAVVVVPRCGGRDVTTMDVRMLLPVNRDQVPAGLVEAIDEGRALAVDLVMCTSTYGGQPFEGACDQGREYLAGAGKISVVDALDVQRKKDLRPDPVRALSEVEEPAPPPLSPELSGAVREDFAKRLGADPARWDRSSLAAIRTEPGTQERDTRRALLAALDALPAFASVGGRLPHLTRLQTIYHRTVGRDPVTASAESLLVEAAAATGRVRGLPPLVRFVLGVAAAQDRGMEISALTGWLDRQATQYDDARRYLKEQSAPVHWALLDLGPDDPGGLDWAERAERTVTAEVVPPVPGIGPRPYRSIGELPAAVAGILDDLADALPDDARILVDVIAPRELLDLGWDLFGAEAAPGDLRAEHAPRFRWTGQLRNRRLRRAQLRRSRGVDWSVGPRRMDPADGADDQATDGWLELVEKAPVLIGGAFGGAGDPLARMIGKGHGFVFWFPSGEGGAEILERWRKLSGESEYLWDTLPERLLDGLTAGRLPVPIWNTLDGRDRFEMCDGRPQSPSGGSVS